MIKRFLNWKKYKKSKRVSEILFLQKMNEILAKELRNKELENKLLEQNKLINEALDIDKVKNVIELMSNLQSELQNQGKSKDELLSVLSTLPTKDK